MADALPLPKGAIPVEGDGQLPLPKGAVPIEQEKPQEFRNEPGMFRTFKEYPHDVAENFRAGRSLIESGERGLFKDPVTILDPDAMAKILLGTAGEVMSPITGATDAFVANPIKRMIPGRAGEVLGNAAGMGTSLVGGGVGIVKGAQSIGRAATKAGEVASRLKPGAMKDAQALVSGVGEASDASILGSKMYRDLRTRINDLVKDRREVASKLKREYFNQGIAKEQEVANAYRADLQNAIKLKERDLSPEQKKLIQDSIDHLGKDPSIEALETERRRLSNIASGEAEGYDSIQKLFAGSMAKNLREKLVKSVPAAEKFFNAYSEMSAPINMFEDTVLGKRITKGASDFLPEQPYYDRATLPPAFFKTKDSVEMLKKLVAGDEKFVNDAASEYAASALKDLGAKDARAWAAKNKIWLDEVPDVQTEVERYVGNLEKVSHTQERVTKAIKRGAIGGALAEGYHRLSNLMGW